MAKNRTEAEATPEPDQVTIQLIERGIRQMNFYKTYDLMTGVRIAATLGGFFGLMVLLVVYKSKCKSRSLSDDNLETMAAGLNGNAPGRRNLSIADASCWLGLAAPNQITHPEIPTTPPPVQRWVDVGSSRRLSWMTSGLSWSSCETSYLDRRTPHTHFHSQNSPIDIKVIQATPEISPCASRNSVYNDPWQKETLHVTKVAPLASLSSFGVASTDRDDHSVGSDSVFLDEELIDTEDEVEGFSTDSDAEKIELPTGSPIRNSRDSEGSSSAENKRGYTRRYSSPNPSYQREKERSAEQEGDGPCWKWRRFSGSWKQQQTQTPADPRLPSSLSPNKETLF